MPPQSRGPAGDPEHPGAGTLFVQAGQHAITSSSKRGSLTGSSRSRSRTPVRFRPLSGSRSRERRKRADEQIKRPWPPAWADVQVPEKVETSTCAAADSLLERGIGDFTLLPFPDGLLGKGKFSTVYKVIGLDGEAYALKHTPLHPHHPLIAARLLREPTLLAQLDPHPCLVGVEGWIRTEGHFYLIEQYAASHIPLLAHPLPLRPSRAAYILDQLVSVMRDCMHSARVCHRDIKPENILVDVETGDVVVLDLGLATQFSASEPKLTTCCGSPAFHSPEIVNALNHPPGAITYYGPELDIWCIALTLLSLLLSTRYPLGASHRSRRTMAIRAMDRLRQLDEEYPPRHPSARWPLSRDEHLDEADDWVRVRVAMRGFLDIDAERRMERFRRYEGGRRWERRLTAWRQEAEPMGIDGDKQQPAQPAQHGSEQKDKDKDKDKGRFKQLSFVKADIRYTLPLHIVGNDDQAEDFRLQRRGRRRSSSKEGTPTPSASARPQTHMPTSPRLTLSNPTNESDRRVLSYLKYLLRTQGILYHCVTLDPVPLFQLVLPLPPASEPGPPQPEAPIPANESGPWFSALNPFRRHRQASGANSITGAARSVSVPPTSSSGNSRGRAGAAAHGTRTQPAIVESEEEETISYLRCYIKIEFQHAQEPHAVRQRSSRRSTRAEADGERPHAGRSSGSVSGSGSAMSSHPSTEPNRSVSRLSSAPGSPRSTSVPLAASASKFSVETRGKASPPGEQSLAVASLQYALAQIIEKSPPPAGIVKGAQRGTEAPNVLQTAGTLAQASSPPPTALGLQISPISETATVSPPESSISDADTPKPLRPPNKRAASTPRLTNYRQPSTMPPLSPALTLSPVPQTPYMLSPLSRQVSPSGANAGGIVHADRNGATAGAAGMAGSGAPASRTQSRRSVSTSASASSSTSASASNSPNAASSSLSAATRTPRLRPLSRTPSRAPGENTPTPPEVAAATSDKSSSTSASASASASESASKSTSAINAGQPDDGTTKRRGPRRAASHASTPRSTHAQLIHALTTLETPSASASPSTTSTSASASASATSASSDTTAHRRPASRRPEPGRGHRKPTSLVIVSISDSRAVPVIGAAFDVPHDHPISPGPGSRDKGKHRAIDVPLPAEPGLTAGDKGPDAGERGGHDDAEQDEEERGRPRSREDSKLLGLGLGPTGPGGAGGNADAASASTSRIRPHESSAPASDANANASAIVAAYDSAPMEKRESSAGKRILDFLGLGFGEHGEMQVGRGRQVRPVGGRREEKFEREISSSRGYSRRESARTASAPPISKDIFG